MRVALLGYDESIAAWFPQLPCEAARLVLAAEVEDATLDALRARWPDVRRVEWDALLDPTACDIVVVAHDPAEDRRAEQLRKLAQLAIPAVIVHPAVQSIVVAYELEMIRLDTRALLVPWVDEAWQASTTRIARLCQDDPTLGPLEQIILERPLEERQRTHVLQQFARDALRLRRWCGELTRISTLADRAASDQSANLVIQGAGPRGVLLRWSVVPRRGDEGARITLVGRAGQVTLHESATETRLEWNLSDGTRVERWPRESAALVWLQRVEEALDGQPPLAWLDAARTIEWVDAAQRSLARGRTIELLLEEHSEHSTFKGLMAAGGCLVLLGGLLLFLIAGIFAPTGWSIFRYWPHALLTIMGGFLALQTFKLAFPRPTSHD